jgi:hypothetical protein
MKTPSLSFHDATLCLAIIVSMLGLILGLLFLFKPDDSLLSNKRLLVIFCSTVATLSMGFYFLMFSPVRRQLHKNAQEPLRNLLGERGYSSLASARGFECWAPEPNHFLRFQSERVWLGHRQNGDIVAQFPRYMLSSFPREFWHTPTT